MNADTHPWTHTISQLARLQEPELPWYICGPMTHVPQFNYPAFDEAAEYLRLHGVKVITPAELDAADLRESALASPDGAPSSGGPSWGDALARDVKLVADRTCGIILLTGKFGPKNMTWRESRGAKLELFVALLDDKPVYMYPCMRRLSKVRILAEILGREVIE